MTLDQWAKTLNAGPFGQFVAVIAIAALGAALLLSYIGKRDESIRGEMRKEMDQLEERVAALERRFTEARAINVAAIQEATRLGEVANHLCTLLVRQAAVLG